MRSPIGGKRSVKVFILYLLENINYPMEFSTIADIMMQTDYVTYLDFAECFYELCDLDLIRREDDEDGTEKYIVSDKGRCVARELRGAVTPGILNDSLGKALVYLDFKKRGIVPSCNIKEASRGRIYITCKLTEKDEVIFEQTLMVDTYERAKMIQANFYDRPQVIYKGVVALMCGQVNYLFEK